MMETEKVRWAVTGHRDLTERTVPLVEEAIRATLAPYRHGLVGVSCLAAGADQIFARAVLDLGGRLEVIVAAHRFRDSLPSPARAGYDRLMGQAARIRVLPCRHPAPGAYAAAGAALLASADRLLAVWDSRPARGRGGTAEVVAHAERRAMAVHVVWPAGARRETDAGPSIGGSLRQGWPGLRG
jgi:hypothetical protein